jgi:hypothetical protein
VILSMHARRSADARTGRDRLRTEVDRGIRPTPLAGKLGYPSEFDRSKPGCVAIEFLRDALVHVVAVLVAVKVPTN